MFLEGRKHSRSAQRFLVQVSSVGDPRVSELAFVEDQSPSGIRLASERSWEPGAHVDVKSVEDGRKARARVVYCTVLGHKKFVIGLNILRDEGKQGRLLQRE